MRISIAGTSARLARACAVCITCAPIPLTLHAKPAESPASPRLVAWVEQTLAGNPELQAAAAAVEAARARSAGAARPLYNPELELEYERSDINKTTAEVLQSFDWHGKREARERVAEGALAVARAEYEALREQLAGELLNALASYGGSRAAVELSARRVTLLGRFADIASERGRAGDLGQVEVELAQLAYAEGKMAAGSDKAALSDALDALYRVAGAGRVPDAGLSEVPPQSLPQQDDFEELVARHPAVRVARSRARVASAAVRRAEVDRRADPTIGVRGGQEDREALIGLRISIPLQLRNDFRAEVDAARSESTAAMHSVAQIERQTLARLNAADDRYRALLSAWKVWERKGRGSLQTRLELLERLWRVGDLSTTDYLVQVKQSLEMQNAGLTLQRDLWRAWILWLRAAGQVQSWLGLKGLGDES